MRWFRRPDVTPLHELWRAPVPGHAQHCIVSDAGAGAVFVADGWGVPYPALRVHRFDLRTGAETASFRTRHQGVGAMTVTGETLWVATDSRLFRLRADDLSVEAEWDKGVVRYTQQLLAADDVLVAANWLAPRIGVFDPATGKTRRVDVGAQPVLVRHDGEVLVFAGFDGGVRTLDVATARLCDPRPTPPVTAAASADRVWCVRGGRRTGGQGEPRVWSRGPTSGLVGLGSPPVTARVRDECSKVAGDATASVLWCVVGRGEDGLDRLDARTGGTTGWFGAETGARLRHLDPDAHMAFAVKQPRDSQDADESTLVAYRLPESSG